MKDITNTLPFNTCPQDIGLKGDCGAYAQCSECWKQALEGYRVWLEDISKPENRPNDKRSTGKGMFMPESPKDAEMDDLRRSVAQLETEIEMLWNEVNRLKRKQI